MRVDRWVLDPRRVIPTLFVTQCAVWYFGMPEVPSIPGTAPRFHGEVAPLRYLLIFATLLGGMLAGEAAWRAIASRHVVRDLKPAEALLRLRGAARVALLFTGIGEVIYIRSILGDPGSIVRAFYLGAFATVGEDVSGARVVGASSLNNLFIIPVAIYALLAFHPDVPPDDRRTARRTLTYIGAAVLFHALILTARMFVLYFAMVVMAAFLIARGGRTVARVRTVVACAVGILVVVWCGEMLRGGLPYALANQISLFAPETQGYVRSRLVEAYLASDLNNAFTLLECRPAFQAVSTTALRSLVVHPMAYEEACQGWQSSYGTVNTLALWWFDSGWFALTTAFLVGCWLGTLHAAVSRGRLGMATLYFLVSYPGFYAISRVNYYGLTIFLLPAGFLAIVSVLQLLMLGVSRRWSPGSGEALSAR